METFKVNRGASPVILSFPHAGTFVPDRIWEQLNDNGRILADTDWHVDKLYEGLLPEATTVRAVFHRYVIDANRDPSGQSLYPGQNTTGLIPHTDFDGQPIWKVPPSEAAIAERLGEFFAPYHAALEAEIDRVKSIHGIAIVYDCHSIRSRIPFLFEGQLPDFNIGTHGGRTCDPAIESAAVATARAAHGFTWVLNGRFKGGYTTRHYGRQDQGVHAIQMELAQSAYLTQESAPFTDDPVKSEALRHHLQLLLRGVEAAAAFLK